MYSLLFFLVSIDLDRHVVTRGTIAREGPQIAIDLLHGHFGYLDEMAR